MVRYLPGGLLFLVTGALVATALTTKNALGHDFLWWIDAASMAYATATVVWVISAATEQRRFWIPLLLVWLPWVLPMALIVWILRDVARNDSVALAASPYFGPAHAAFLGAVLGSAVLLWRRLAIGQATAAGSDE